MMRNYHIKRKLRKGDGNVKKNEKKTTEIENTTKRREKPKRNRSLTEK